MEHMRHEYDTASRRKEGNRWENIIKVDNKETGCEGVNRTGLA
jgi:hypothetical protein